MNLLRYRFAAARLSFTLAATFVGALFATFAQAGIDIHMSGVTSGTGQQFVYAPSTNISGTMAASVPKFNPALGTLVQADFEWAGSITGTWVPVANPGVSTFNLSGLTYADTELMGNLAVGFSDPYTFPIGSNSFEAAFTNLTVTSGAFFNSLTGVGTVPMTWLYSGSNSLSEPALGTGPGGEGFSWGGSVHVAYFYVPEPGTFALFALGAIGIASIRRKYRRTKS
jgi:hypothetical protein